MSKQKTTRKITNWKAVAMDLLDDGHINQDSFDCYVAAHTRKLKVKKLRRI